MAYESERRYKLQTIQKNITPQIKPFLKFDICMT